MIRAGGSFGLTAAMRAESSKSATSGSSSKLPVELAPKVAGKLTKTDVRAVSKSEFTFRKVRRISNSGKSFLRRIRASLDSLLSQEN